MVILVGWQVLWPKIFPPAPPAPSHEKAAPEKPAQKPAAKPAEEPAEKPGEKPAEKPAEIKAPTLRAVGAPAGQAPTPVVIGSAACDGGYDFEAECVAKGAALKRLTLSRDLFLRTVADRRQTRCDREPMALVLPQAPFPAFLVPEVKVWLTGAEGPARVDLSDVTWRAVAARNAAEQAVFEVDVQDADGKPLLTVRRLYVLAPAKHAQGAAPPTYDLAMHLEFVKADSRVDRVAYAIQGPPALPREDPRTDVRQSVVGMRLDPKVELNWFPAAKYEAGKGPTPESMPLSDVPGPKVQWFGEVERYFAVIAVPGREVDGKFEAQKDDFYAVAAKVFHYSETGAGTAASLAGIRVETRELAFPKDGALRHEFLVFAGPKDAKILQDYYGSLSFPDLIQYGGCCMFGGFQSVSDLFAGVSRFMVTLLEVLFAVVRNYGVAVILLVVILRVCLHPVTRWSTKSMMKMQKLGPKMAALKEKYADDKEQLNKEMAKFAREEGFNPVSGCLPMVIQMPIWIGLYGALQSAIELRQAAFIPVSWLPVGSIFLQDLAQPDSLIHWATPFFLPGRDIPLLGWVISWLQSMLVVSGGLMSFNVLPILMGVTMYLQQRLTPTAAATTGPQAQQQKIMMNFMMVFMAVVLYSAPAGLCLYIFTSSLLGWAEMRYLKKRYEAMEAAAALATAAGAPVARPLGKTPPPPPRKPAVSSSRDRSPAERIQAWIEKKLAGAKQPPEGKGKGKKG